MESEQHSIAALKSYGSHLKGWYQELLPQHNSHGDSSTQTDHTDVSLARVLPATVKRGKIWDDFTKSTVHDTLDDILHMKEPFSFEALLELFSNGTATKGAVLFSGATGVGKTSVLLKMLGGWASGIFLNEYALVVYLSLQDSLILSTESLADILPSVLGAKEAVGALYENQGDSALFILDGWKPTHSAVPLLASLALDRKFLPKSKVIVSTTPALSAELRPHCDTWIEVLGFRSDTQRRVLEKAFACTDTVQQCISAVDANPLLSSMFHIPCLLKIFSQVFLSNGKKLPTTLTELMKLYISQSSDSSRVSTSFNTNCLEIPISKLVEVAYTGYTSLREVYTASDLLEHKLDPSTSPVVLEPVSLGSSAYKFCTPLFQYFLVAIRIANLNVQEQCEHLREIADYPTLSTMLCFIVGLVNLDCPEIIQVIQMLGVESAGEPSLLSLFQALFEAQNTSACKLVASAFSDVIILSSLYISRSNIQAIGYVAACASQARVVELHLRNCSLDDSGVGILMDQLSSSSCPSSGIKLNLQLNRITPRGAELIANTIVNCGSAKLLSLNVGNIRPGYNNIRDPGAEHIFRALTSDVHLTELCLSNNSVSAKGAATIGRMLSSNESLQILDIQGNIIGEEGTTRIAEGLKQNSCLKTLNLYCCYTADGGVRALADMLTVNTTLIDLNLSKNEITAEGVEALGTTLNSHKCSLMRLNLCSNWIDDRGLECLFGALSSNMILNALDVMANAYTDAGRKLIAATMKENWTLCELRIDCPWVIGRELMEINRQRLENGHKQLKYKF